MYIDKKSNLYRLALYGTFFENYKIENNLCPFMRKVFKGTLLTTIIYPILGAFVILVLSSPLYQALTALYYGDWAYWAVEEPFFVIGTTIYAVILTIFPVAITYGLLANTSFKHSVKVMSRKTTDAIVVGAEKAGLSPIVAWIKAVHDKVCIPLSFKK